MTLGRCRGHVTLITLEVVAQLGARQDRALTSSLFVYLLSLSLVFFQGFLRKNWVDRINPMV